VSVFSSISLRTRKILSYLLSLLAIAILFQISLTTGIVHVHESIWSLIGKNTVDANTVWQLRFPRVLGALIIGAGLGVAGAIAQGIFRNPLAEPTLIGLSSGATLGTITVIATGVGTFGTRTIVAGAVIGAALAALLVQWLAPAKGFGFLLTGIAISSILTSVAGLLISMSAKPGIQSLSFWDFGSLSLLSNQSVGMIAPYIEAGIIAAFFVARKLDIYSLGDHSARYMGVEPRRLRLWAVLALALLVGASVSAVGSIAFLGLLVPHIVRLLIGPGHRRMLSLSALVGALVLMLADLLARTLYEPNEIPLGLITSLLGAPVLIVLLKVKRASWVSND
jgi:iron complex transport system permease protein